VLTEEKLDEIIARLEKSLRCLAQETRVKILGFKFGLLSFHKGMSACDYEHFADRLPGNAYVMTGTISGICCDLSGFYLLFLGIWA
jgi:hypothetical protein